MVCCWFGSMGSSGSAGFDAAVSLEFEWLLLASLLPHHTSSSGWCAGSRCYIAWVQVQAAGAAFASLLLLVAFHGCSLLFRVAAGLARWWCR